MKIEKDKLPGDENGFFFELEKGEKFEEMIPIDYKIIKDTLKRTTGVFKNFAISSGKVVLTTIGEPNYSFRVMWNFPTGTFDAYIINNYEDADSIFIPFIDFDSKTLRFHLFLENYHKPKGVELPAAQSETQCLPVDNKHLFLMDEAKCSEYNNLVYPNRVIKYEETIKELNDKEIGNTLILPFEYIKNSKLSKEKNTERFYFAYAGYTLDGDPAYLWMRKRKGNK